MLKRLQRKFVFLTTSISIVVMILIAITINIINYNSIISYSDEILEILINNDFSATTGTPPHPRIPREFAFTTRFFIVHTNENNEAISVNTKNISSINSEDAINYIDIVNKSEENIGTIDDFRFKKTESAFGYSYVFLDIEEDLMGFEDYRLYSILIVGSAVLLIFILSCLLSKKAVSPIADSFERQKGFITNVSHEFKTPLAIIKADCDVIELDNGEGEWTDSIKTQISRLDALVEDLVSLTKLDEKVEIIKTDFSLSDAITDTANEFSASIKNAELDVVLSIEQNLSYNGDETSVRNLFSILIQNGVKYSLPQTGLKLSLRANGNKKIFTIENACESIEVGKHNQWFERFYRGDKSRNSRTKGFGIGLSIAKSICDLHGAKISAESKTGKEIVLTVIF